MTVYYDIFFVINLCMDVIVLLVAGALLRFKISFSSALFSACITSAVSVVQSIFVGNTLFAFVISCVSSFLACFIAFKGVRIIKLALAFVIFSVSTSVFSHIITRLFTTLNPPDLLHESSGSGGIIPLIVCALSSLLTFFIGSVRGRIKKNRLPQKTEITIVCEDKTLVLSAYCDSGNLLREPIGGLPVIITGREKMHSIVPRALHGVFFSSDGYLGETSLANARRVRIIPIMPVGTGGARILFGYVPDKIILGGSEVAACVALDNGNSDFGGCEALLPKSLIK